MNDAKRYITLDYHNIGERIGESALEMGDNMNMALDYARNVLNGNATETGERDSPKVPYVAPMSGKAMYHLWCVRHRLMLLQGEAAIKAMDHVIRAMDALFCNPSQDAVAEPLACIRKAKRILENSRFRDEDDEEEE